jgi:hypothetical protein
VAEGAGTRKDVTGTARHGETVEALSISKVENGKGAIRRGADHGYSDCCYKFSRTGRNAPWVG